MTKKKGATAPNVLNPRSGKVVLFALRKHGELPRRDLNAGDLNALAYRRALLADPRKRPADIAAPEMLEALAGELVAGGFYSRDVPRETESSKLPIVVTREDAIAAGIESSPPIEEQPAAPAEEPEV